MAGQDGTGFGQERALIRPDVLAALDRLYPDGGVELPETPWTERFEETVYPKLVRKLRAVPGCYLMWEQEARPEPVWDDGDDPDEDPPSWIDPSTSYHRFFMAAHGDSMAYETEWATESEWQEEYNEEDGDEDWEPRMVPVEGHAGCLVGVSLLEPFAVVLYETYERDEEGGESIPDLDAHVFAFEDDAATQVSDAGPDLFGRVGTEQAQQKLEELRERIATVLKAHRIEVLPVEELRKPAPWLRLDEELVPADPVTVRDALFARSFC